MLKIFHIWIIAIFRDEIAKNSEDHATVEKLFERALNDFQSVEVCERYINWAIDVGMDFALQVFSITLFLLKFSKIAYFAALFILNFFGFKSLKLVNKIK